MHAQNMTMVQVLKRTEAAHASNVSTRFAEVELRIGNEDESGSGVQQLTQNPIVGLYPGANLEPLATFQLQPPASGRFLTLQILSANSLEIGELSVYV